MFICLNECLNVKTNVEKLKYKCFEITSSVELSSLKIFIHKFIKDFEN